MSTEKKKVLFLIHTLQGGGAERVLVDLVNNLPKDKYEVTVMTVVDLGVLKKQLKNHINYRTIFSFKILKTLSGKNDKYEVSTGSTSHKKNLLKEAFIKSYIFFWKHKNMKKFYKKHIKEQYDIEVSFLEGIPAKIIAGSSNEKSRKICWIHVDLINEPKADRFFKDIEEQRKTYDKFDDIICVSKIVKEHFLKKINIDKNKAKILYNPIDSDAIRKKAKAKNINRGNELTFCSIGRLAKQKGYDRLVEAAVRLEKDGYAFKIWIIGAGTEEQKIKARIIDKGVKSVELLGYQNNPYPYIKSSDWFICSSRAEGFSTVVAEAVVLGKAIISTDCSGIREMLGDHSEYGIICENNTEGLINAMKKAINERRLKEHYESMARERGEVFNIRELVGLIEKELTEK